MSCFFSLAMIFLQMKRAPVSNVDAQTVLLLLTKPLSRWQTGEFLFALEKTRDNINDQDNEL